MSKCLYCYLELQDEGNGGYHEACSKKFFGTSATPELPYRFDEIEKLARDAAEQSVTIPGVQPKLSLTWMKTALQNGHSGRLTVMDALDGNYILKPQNSEYPEMPENEHLSMRLAELFKIRTVPSSLIKLLTGELCYLTKRIDRSGENRIHMIDFLQILELEDKYIGTMETVGKKIDELSYFSLMDRLRFFELAVFNFIIGNNDMHLKNFSMWKPNTAWELSPAYDLLNVRLILPKDDEDLALKLGGKKKSLNRGYFDRFGEVLNLNNKQIQSVYKRIDSWFPKAIVLIGKSFLSEQLKAEYQEIIVSRVDRLGSANLDKKSVDSN